MNRDLSLLQPYPFEKLAKLKAEVTPPADLAHIAWSIGEPKHPAPDFVKQVLIDQIDRISNYPTTKGMPELSETIANWCTGRFHLEPNSLTPEQHVIPVTGTREAIFAFTQAVVNRVENGPKPLVLTPNPFYQIYEGATYLSGAEPYYLNCTAETDFIPDYDAIPSDVWQRCQLLYLCSPSNPTAAVTELETLNKLIELADKYDFVIASDECYSEVYLDENNPPVGLLEACAKLGRHDYDKCVVMHSLSKRSNLPGMRSGFIAGDAKLLMPFLQYRTYHGCSMPITHQLASIAAWGDEAHADENRRMYREKFDAVVDILSPIMDVTKPSASFYLWLKTPIADDEFAQKLYEQQNLTVLPGSYVSREVDGCIPGAGYVRMALVATLDECIEGAHRVRKFVESLT